MAVPIADVIKTSVRLVVDAFAKSGGVLAIDLNAEAAEDCAGSGAAGVRDNHCPIR
jgi:hypothetical protein